MIFDALYESAQQGELLLIAGGYCRWHMRRDMSITIYEIISTRPGAGSEMLEQLKQQGAWSIVARCPAHLLANEWYAKRGFVLERTERIKKSGKELNVWRLTLN